MLTPRGMVVEVVKTARQSRKHRPVGEMVDLPGSTYMTLLVGRISGLLPSWTRLAVFELLILGNFAIIKFLRFLY